VGREEEMQEVDEWSLHASAVTVVVPSSQPATRLQHNHDSQRYQTAGMQNNGAATTQALKRKD